MFEGAVGYTGNSAIDKKFNFSHNGEELMLWGWKGDYINLGAGAELGIYSKSNINIGSHYHYTTATQYAVPMTIDVKKKDGTQVVYWDSKTAQSPVNVNQWWITGFNPQYQNVQYNDLDVTVIMDCTNNRQLYNDIQNQYNTNNQDYIMTFNNGHINIFY